MKISVLMPVFNARRYVKQAIESVLSQTFNDFELVIVDDGSTDGTDKIVEQLSKRDSRVRFLARENKGLVSTLNEMLELANADVVARMDADDVCYPERFSKQFAFLESHPDHVAVGTRFRFIDDDDMPLFESGLHCSNEEVNAVLLKPDIGLLHPSVMMRRVAVSEAGGYTSAFPHVEDLDLFLRLGELGLLANLPEVLMDYRLHASSVTHTYAMVQHVAGLRAVRAACERRGLTFGRDHEIENPSFAFETEVSMHRKWAWCALSSGNVRSARKHALRALRISPIDGQNYHLLACALRGH